MPSAVAVCVTGMPGCGKEEFLKIALEEGIPVIRMGDLVREEARHRGISLTDEGVGGMANEERKIHGPDVWARRTLERITSERVVIDGVRSLAEVETFRKAFRDRLIVVAVHASPKTRYARISSRKRKDDVATEEELRVRDQRELQWGVGQVIALADYMIVNEGSLEDFKGRAREVLKRVFG